MNGSIPKTTLQEAAEDGNLAKVEEILEAGYPVDERGSEPAGRIPSMLAEEGDKAVLQAGFDLGRTPLMLAIWKGHLAVVERLLEAGAERKDKDALGHTPLATHP